MRATVALTDEIETKAKGQTKETNMGAFEGFKNASRGYTSNVLQEGTHVVRLDECAFFSTETKGEMWKNTLTVLETDNDRHRPGEVVHTFFKTASGKQVFQRNLKSFTAGVLGVEDDDVGEDDLDAILGELNPMAGMIFVVHAKKQTAQKTKDENGNPVQYLVYSWGEAMTDEEVRAAIPEDVAEKYLG